MADLIELWGFDRERAATLLLDAVRVVGRQMKLSDDVISDLLLRIESERLLERESKCKETPIREFVKGVARKLRRKRSRKRRHVPLSSEPVDRPSCPRSEEVLAKLDSLIDLLPDPYQTIAILKTVAKATNDDVADLLMSLRAIGRKECARLIAKTKRLLERLINGAPLAAVIGPRLHSEARKWNISRSRPRERP